MLSIEKGQDKMEGLLYNHEMMLFLKQQLDRAEALERPVRASEKELDEFAQELQKGRRLLGKHTGPPFDIKRFYSIKEACSGVERSVRI